MLRETGLERATLAEQGPAPYTRPDDDHRRRFRAAFDVVIEERRSAGVLPSNVGRR
jgi:hypothetical protein